MHFAAFSSWEGSEHKYHFPKVNILGKKSYKKGAKGDAGFSEGQQLLLQTQVKSVKSVSPRGGFCRRNVAATEAVTWFQNRRPPVLQARRPHRKVSFRKGWKFMTIFELPEKKDYKLPTY